MKERWQSRSGFVLAAVGSAIGLGNIWRFPYITYENGGGAFLIPYLFAMLFLGIPFIILQMTIGHKFRAGAPHAFFRANRYFTWAGWVQSLLAGIISVYYVVIIGWAISYVFYSFSFTWGANTEAFFSDTHLNTNGHGPMDFGNIQTHLIIPLIIAWAITFSILFCGIGKGIEKASRIMMPMLFFLVIILGLYAIFQPGAVNGLNWLFEPDFDKLLDPGVWLAAFGQIFFSLSVGFGVMIAYASYLPKKSDIANNAALTAFINCGFSMLAGVMVFSILGNMAYEENVSLTQVVSSGIGLSFITIPEAFNHMPGGSIMAPLFFISLVFAGSSSHISIVESVVTSLMDKTGWSRKRLVSLVCLGGFVISLLFVTNGGLTLLDIVDQFSNQIILIIACLSELILFCWFFNIHDLRKHCNLHSDFIVGKGWVFCLKYLGISLLATLLFINLGDSLQQTYGNYPSEAILVIGWGLTALTFFVSILLSLNSTWHEKKYEENNA